MYWCTSGQGPYNGCVWPSVAQSQSWMRRLHIFGSLERQGSRGEAFGGTLEYSHLIYFSITYGYETSIYSTVYLFTSQECDLLAGSSHLDLMNGKTIPLKDHFIFLLPSKALCSLVLWCHSDSLVGRYGTLLDIMTVNIWEGSQLNCIYYPYCLT